MSDFNDDLYLITIPTGGGDSEWDELVTIMGNREVLESQFDLKNLPAGAVLRRGKEARQYFEQSMSEEFKYRWREAQNGRN